MLLANSFSFNMVEGFPCHVKAEAISVSEAAEILSKGFTSVVGHADTTAVFSSQLGTQAAFLRAVRARLLGEIFHAEQLVQEIKRLLTVDTEHRNQQADVIIQRLRLMVADPNSDIAHVAQQSGIDSMRLIEISEGQLITAKELRQLTSVEY